MHSDTHVDQKKQVFDIMDERSRSSEKSGETRADFKSKMSGKQDGLFGLSRRGFVGTLAAMGSGIIADSVTATTRTEETVKTPDSLDVGLVQQRVEDEFYTRVGYSEAQLLNSSSHGCRERRRRRRRRDGEQGGGRGDEPGRGDSQTGGRGDGRGRGRGGDRGGRRDASQTERQGRFGGQDRGSSAHPSNGQLSDDAVVSKFGKSLKHNEDSGLPTDRAYESLVKACETGSGYGSIQQADLDPDEDGVVPSDLVDGELNPKPLVQPETAWTFTTEGASTAQLRIAVPPAFDDPETGAEMVELYWRALTRDVNFRDYDSDALVAAAAAELDSLDAYQGPGADDNVTTGNVFRGITPGSEVGPYVSQFLWKTRNLGRGPVDQRIQPQLIGETASLTPSGTVGPPTDYLTTVEDWLKVQKGVIPATDDSLPGNGYSQDCQYIVNGRDMCERVHDDPPYRQVQKAAQVLIFSMNAPLDGGLPYTLKPFEKPSPSRRDVDAFTAQTTLPFNDFGPLYIEKKVLKASEHGQKAAWHKKWNVHRRLRPEEYAGRVQAAVGAPDSNGDTLDTTGGGYPVPGNLLSSQALQLTAENYGSYLLPQAYAEGSPTHPSYPAGHSVVAGAGVTVLKALFDGDYVFPTDQKVVPTRDGTELETAGEVTGDPLGVGDTLTVRGELNKLASNMALGRNRAGIHYRSDGIEGLRLGEAAAIRFLEDQLSLPRRIADRNGGRLELSLETFEGDRVAVTPTV